MQSLVLWLRAEWDRILGTVLVVAGASCLVVTYQAVANDRFVAEQMADLASGGLGGLFLVAVGIMLRLQADLHDEWRKLDRIEAALRGTPLPDPAELLAQARPNAPTRPERPRELQPALAESRAVRHRWPTVIGGVGLALAAVIVGLGYDRAAGTGDVADATGGLGLGVAGLLVAGGTVGLTQLIGRNRLAARKGRLLAPFLRPAAAGPYPAAPGGPGFVLVAPGLTRFHMEGCPTLSRTPTTRLRRQDVSDALSPCGICGAS